MNLLEPFRPTDADPFDAAKAAHLARRAGFAATPDVVAELVALGVDGAVARYVDFPPEDEALEEEIRSLGGALVDFAARNLAGEVDAVRRWWLFRMVHGNHPLQEKLTLLWHDHFACQESKVLRTPMLVGQNRTFRRHAAGPFRALIGAIARDPAMLHFLDNRVSTREAPNENWARELLELFTLGVDRYTQQDVVELSRVFTGWTTPKPNEAAFVFDPALHDPGDKQLFGETLRGREGDAGIEEGEEALDRIVARPDCARFIASKLLQWFATHAPEEPEIAALAAVLAESELDVRAALRALFRSRWFLRSEMHYGLVRNPVEVVVAGARTIGVRNADRAGLELATRRMGMQLFEPPSVGGWEHGDAWTGPSTAAARLDVALQLAELPHSARRSVGRATIDLDALGAPARADDGSLDPGLLADALVHRAGGQVGDPSDRWLDPERRAAIVAFLEGVAERTPPDMSSERRAREVVRAGLHVVLALPELALA